MGKLDGRVALITGGAQSQGRSHALTLAREGADIVVCDLDEQVANVPYEMGTEEKLNETVRMVEETGRRCVSIQADVRDTEQVQEVVDRAISEFGKVDILLANAGIFNTSPVEELTDQAWNDLIDTNLTGVFKSIRAVLPHMAQRGYGRIVATASVAGRGAFPQVAHYTAAKWGVIGLTKTVALEFAEQGITANAVCPTQVNTPMIRNEEASEMFAGVENPTEEQAAAGSAAMNAQPIPWVESEDISNAILFLVSDEARYITGEALAVSAGATASNAA